MIISAATSPLNSKSPLPLSTTTSPPTTATLPNTTTPFFGGEEGSESELWLSRGAFLNVKRTDWMWRLFLPIRSDRNHEAVSGGDMSEAVKFPATLVVVIRYRTGRGGTLRG
ncbi:Gibberellin receptor GID1A [Camellia lanceoleosa]|uniref:Gibberellin receptor GID1A n=1 Tax=Camellia lanceoleosa TaxID=1840588 RepID=A0ACC0I9H4_9ERIC|nr:Gibberellin receptor GID1A [Camellia lanceoleosa]